MTRLINATENHSMIMIGDNIEEILSESMKYVVKERDYYLKSIKEELQERNNSIVTHWSCSYGYSLIIYFDKNNEVSIDDIEKLNSKEFYRTYKHIFS